MYELYVQSLVPITLEVVPFRYKSREYLERKMRIILQKRGKPIRKIEDTDSSSEDESDPNKFKNLDCFFDEDQLMKM